MNVPESETWEQQTNGHSINFERVNESARRNQVKENKNDNQITRAVSNVVMTVENCMHYAILTAVDNVVFPRAEMAVKLITGSTGHGTNSEVENPDRRVFLGNFRNTPLMSASNRLDLDNEINWNDEIRNDENFKDGDFPVLRSN